MRKAGASEQDVAKLRAEALERLIEARLVETVVARLEVTASDDGDRQHDQADRPDERPHRRAALRERGLPRHVARGLPQADQAGSRAAQRRERAARAGREGRGADVRALYDAQFGVAARQGERDPRAPDPRSPSARTPARTTEQACAMRDGVARERVADAASPSRRSRSRSRRWRRRTAAISAGCRWISSRRLDARGARSARGRAASAT